MKKRNSKINIKYLLEMKKILYGIKETAKT